MVENIIQVLEKIASKEVFGVVEDRTIEQQKTMEEIKEKVDGDTPTEHDSGLRAGCQSGCITND